MILTKKIRASEYIGRELEALGIMQHLVLMSGITQEELDKIKQMLVDDPEKHRYLFLSIFESGWAKANSVYTLPGLTPEIWERYRLTEQTGLTEQELLYDALKILYSQIKRMLRS